MSVPETHYVLIVHGTWNAPTAGVTKWYQKGGAFADALAQRLESTPLAGAVWRSCAGKPTDFSWSGDNTHEARLEAAKRLCKELLAIRAADETARIDIIAHSHGGNVVLKALELYLSALAWDADRKGVAKHFFARYAVERPDVVEENVGSRPLNEEILAAVLAETLPDWPQARRDALKDGVAEELQALRFARAAPRAAALLKSWIYIPSNMRRHNSEIIRQWCRNDPQSHRIGRLVFLGTPFLHKRWHRHNWRYWLRTFLKGIVGIPISLLPLYILVLFYGALLALLPFVDFVDFNPLDWPIWLQAVTLVGAFVYGSVIVEQRRDINLYHAPPPKQYASFVTGRVVRRARPATVTPVQVLVVTAAQLDEALLGLSAEPLVDAYLPPEINKLTAWDLRWRLRDPPAGAGFALGDFVLRAGAWLVLAGRNVVKLLAWPVDAATLRPLVRAYLRRSLRRLVLAQASGLPPHEFNAANLTVRPDIGVPEVFDEGKIWNIVELVAGAPSLLPASVEKERYAFLWSRDALAERLCQSRIWPRLDTKEYWSPLKRERGYSLDYEELMALKRACLVIEEKASELGGAVQLSHSGYYGYKPVVDAIVAFLVAGQRPTDH